MTIKAGVIMVSNDTQKILVVINKSNMGPENLKFGLPKGHAEKDATGRPEFTQTCAMREFREETGLIVRIFKKDPRIVVSETTYYLVKARECLEPSPQDNTEIGDSKWVTWDDIMSTDCNRGLRLIRDKLKKADSNLMERLRSLKPRPIGKSRIKQIDTHHATHMGTVATRHEADRYDSGYDSETDYP